MKKKKSKYLYKATPLFPLYGDGKKIPKENPKTFYNKFTYLKF